REFEWHHDTRYRTIVRVVPLRRNAAHRRSRIAYCARQQTCLLVEIEGGNHAGCAESLNDIHVAAVKSRGISDVPVGKRLPDTGRKRQLSIQFRSFERASVQRV